MVDQITVEQLDKILESLFDKRIEVDEATAAKTKLENELRALKTVVILHLKELDRSNYAGGRGSVTMSEKRNVTMPKDVEHKNMLWSWMRDRDIFDQYATVNSRSLNALYKAEYQAALEKGPDALMTFSLPGIEAPTVHEDLTIRKSRK